MKPLIHLSLDDFLYRFENFQNSQITAIDIISPVSIAVSIDVQDRQRSFDWIGMRFLFEEIVDASLIESSRLAYIDMDEGLSILYENGLFYFMIGDYKTPNGTKDALCYIIAKSLKYQEAQPNF